MVCTLYTGTLNYEAPIQMLVVVNIGVDFAGGIPGMCPQ